MRKNSDSEVTVQGLKLQSKEGKVAKLKVIIMTH